MSFRICKAGNMPAFFMREVMRLDNLIKNIQFKKIEFTHLTTIFFIVAILFFEYSISFPEADLVVIFLTILGFIFALKYRYTRLEWLFLFVFFFYILIINHFIGIAPGKGVRFLYLSLFVYSVYGLLRANERVYVGFSLGFIYSLLLISAVVNIFGFAVSHERQYGLFLDSSTNGLYSLLGLVINLYYLERCKNRFLTLALICSSFIFLFSIAFVQARLVVAFLVLFMALFIFRAIWIKHSHQLKQVLIMVPTFIFAEWLYLFTTAKNQWDVSVEGYTSLNGRIQQWRAGWQYLIEHNFMPSGFATWKAVYPQYREEYGYFGDFGHYIHNDYLQFLITGGPLPVLILIGLFVFALWLLFKLVLSRRDIGGTGFYPLVLILVIHSFVLLNFLFHRLDAAFFYCAFWVWFLSLRSREQRAVFKLSRFLKVSLALVSLSISPYLLSNQYYIYKVDKCRVDAGIAVLCNQKLQSLMEVVAPDDLAKHMPYIDVIDRMVGNYNNDFDAYTALVAYENAYYFSNRAIEKGYATSDHYAFLAYASFYYSQWRLGVIEDQYISDLVDEALRLDPGLSTAHLVRAMMLSKNEGPKIAGLYLLGFMNSDWFPLIKGLPQGDSVIKAINGFNRLAGED